MSVITFGYGKEGTMYRAPTIAGRQDAGATNCMGVAIQGWHDLRTCL
jgi:hypothetical protein